MDKKFKEWFDQKVNGRIIPANSENEMYRAMLEWTEEAYKLGKEVKKKSKIESDGSYPEFVRIWCESFPEYGFTAMDGKKIKSIIQQTKNWLSAGGKDSGAKASADMFQYIMNYVKKGDTWFTGKDLATIDSKYRSLIIEIKNGKQQASKKPASARDYINNLRKEAGI